MGMRQFKKKLNFNWSDTYFIGVDRKSRCVGLLMFLREDRTIPNYEHHLCYDDGDGGGWFRRELNKWIILLWENSFFTEIDVL